jgi:chromosome segregation ATPase
MKPLNAAIKELRETIKDLRDDLRNNEEKREAMDRRLVAVEASAKSAHHRIDSLERR